MRHFRAFLPAATLPFALLLASCADVVHNLAYVDTSKFGYSETKKMLETSLRNVAPNWGGKSPGFHVSRYQVMADKITFTAQEKYVSALGPEQSCEIVYAGQNKLGVVHTGQTVYVENLKSSCPKIYPVWDFESRHHAAAFLQAILRFQQLGPSAEADEKRQKEAFLRALEEYKGKPRPPLPEEARRFKVKAEHAFDERRYGDAAANYQEGLRIAPWWAEGYYNHALILAELGQFGRAIDQMNVFLDLAPESPEARKAKDTIYIWETKVTSQPSSYPSVNAPAAHCFVATAAYGDSSHPDVEYLRHFRNKVLKKSAPGRAFIDFYWWAGPKAALLVRNNLPLRDLTRGMIAGTVLAFRYRDAR